MRFRNQGAAFAVSLYSPPELQSAWLCGQATPSVRLWHLFLQEFQLLCLIGDVSTTCFGRLLLYRFQEFGRSAQEYSDSSKLTVRAKAVGGVVMLVVSMSM